jgi:predicted DsbA family dithiol-disulfide isomerase
MTLKTLQIDFVSDVACPWCAVGLGGLQQAAALLQGEVALDLHFQPFELNPQMGPEGEDIDEHLQRKYGGTKAQFDAARATIRQRGEAVGFQFGQRSRIWNTFDAHRLLHWAGLLDAQARDHSQGAPADAQQRLKQALLQAYHGDGRNPGDHTVLLDLVGQLGLDVARAQAILASDEFAAEVRAEERRWQQLGISAVPAVVVNMKHLISGGQPPEVYLQALRQIAAEG